jgi:hypothetical protein
MSQVWLQSTEKSRKLQRKPPIVWQPIEIHYGIMGNSESFPQNVLILWHFFKKVP